MVEPSNASLAVKQAATHLFYYQNVTSQIQIVRVDRAIPRRVEKVVFPGERMLFYSISEASLNIHTNTTAGLTLVSHVLCSQLQVVETEV